MPSIADDNDFGTAESGALEARLWKNERNKQHFMTGSSLRLAPLKITSVGYQRERNEKQQDSVHNKLIVTA